MAMFAVYAGSKQARIDILALQRWIEAEEEELTADKRR
jgi:hypothetical protein